MESIDKIPVSSGTLTDLRSTIPGASCSIGRYSVASISPFPSIGAPSGSTIRPMYASPTGIPAFLDVYKRQLAVSAAKKMVKQQYGADADQAAYDQFLKEAGDAHDDK